MPFPKTPALATDCVVIDAEERLLLIRRGHPPFKGKYALPGGFVDVGESVEDACRRELREETGVKAGRLELIGVYSDPWRDPRGHVLGGLPGARGQGNGESRRRRRRGRVGEDRLQAGPRLRPRANSGRCAAHAAPGQDACRQIAALHPSQRRGTSPAWLRSSCSVA